MIQVIYTVQPNDRILGLQGLALWFYGAAERWIELYRHNRHVIGDDPIALWPGQQLILPCDPASSHFAPRVTLYLVQPEDYREGLAGIARKHYGDAARAEAIYRVNRGVIGENPALLHSGQLLIIP